MKWLVAIIFTLFLVGCTSPIIFDNGNLVDIPDDVEELAKQTVKEGPTYHFDGSLLSITSIGIEKTNPPTYTFEFKFFSSHAGYGDRSGQMVAQVLTTHTALVKVRNNEIVVFLIDDVWDELTQKSLEREDTELKFQPMACTTEPWLAWVEEDAERFENFTSSTEQIEAYYEEEFGVFIIGVDSFDNGPTCRACFSCPKQFGFIARVSAVDTSILLSDGWERS